ncbi:MAG: AmmeMemoRadiSam system protein B [Candidatus Omnitrophica bacterium]|nr:AmmeMemoRadiSam system protein B [Candidatus Omnitrophota bacterium]
MRQASELYFFRFCLLRLYWAAVFLGLGCLLLSAPVLAQTRTAKVAGSFYPENTQDLRRQIESFLIQQPGGCPEGKVRILLAPHAGTVYSGPVAAKGYACLQGSRYDGVVVVGFTHRQHFEGSSVDTATDYQTPLGKLPVDRKAVDFLLQADGIQHVASAHESAEHSLEVQLPFLQLSLGSLPIVPILMGSHDWADIQKLSKALAGLSQKGDYLFVFSTDLSHYHSYEQAKVIDQTTTRGILFESPKALYGLFRKGQAEACGQGPILTSLLLASKLGFPGRHLLSYANSGDTSGERQRVVGYAAIGMVDPDLSALEGRISSEAGAALVAAARQALVKALDPQRPVKPVILEEYPELKRASGLFVTLRKSGALRGCIGRTQAKDSLASLIETVALEAAFNDPRFPPVEAKELASVQIEVSVLSPPKRLNQLEDLIAGRDGVILEHAKGRGLFLPQVWEETGWSRVEFLEELASQKAGLRPQDWQQARLYVFQDQIFQE